MEPVNANGLVALGVEGTKGCGAEPHPEAIHDSRFTIHAAAQPPCAIPAEDWARLAGRLTARQLGELREWVGVMHAFLAAPPEGRALVAARLAAEHAGLRGLSLKSLYRKAAAWRRREAERPGRGWEALVPAAAHAAPAGVAANAAFVQFWRGLVLQNQRVSSRAWDKLLAHLRAGEAIPGVGTWRQLYAAEFPGREAPAVCPYRAGVLLPAGWSKANLMRLLPSKWALTAARQGTLAASALLPSVPRTRAGLLRGQIVEIDDMWHDVKVRAADGAPAERCVELALLDVATGFRSYLLKPIRRRDDGTREVVMARMMPYLIGYWLIVQGYAPGGATVMGEHGTAAADKRLAAAVEAATGGKVRFLAGGKLSKPLAQGLWEGRPRGNFRFKARLEGNHSLLHDLLADVPGQVGKDRDAAPEDLYARDKAEAALLRACRALAARDPDLPARLRWPYLPFQDYAALVAEAVAELNGRTDHALEGWAEQGFVETAWRLGPREPWRPLADLEGLPPAVAAAVRAALEADPALTRARRLSPAEAWERREGDVIRADRAFMPLILGEGLAMRATVSAKVELRVKDPAIDFAATVAGVVRTPEGEERLLRRGQEALVWVNPLEPLVAYVAEPAKDGSWRYLGLAPVLAPSHQDDPEGVAANLKIRAKIQALERREILPWAERRAAEHQADVAWNKHLLAEAQGESRIVNRESMRPDGRRADPRPESQASNLPVQAQRAKPSTASLQASGHGLAGATMDDLI